MPATRRDVLCLAAGAVALPVLSTVAHAQGYPSKPVRIIVTAAAGGALNLLARLMAQRLTEKLGQPFIVENRPGGGGNVGAEAVAHSPADGATLLMVTMAHAANVSLYKLNYDFLHAIAPVAGVATIPNVMVVNPSVPATTIPAFIAYAKAHPGAINMSSAGTATTPHLAGELFKLMAGLDIVHVPYRGVAPAMTDLLSGQVQVMFPTAASAVDFVRTGKLRALGLTSATRWDGLPDVPPIGDFLPGFETSFWTGVGAPANTPPEVIDTLARAIHAGLTDPAISAQIAKVGGLTMPMTPGEFGTLIADETQKWAKVIREGHIKGE